MKNKYKLSIIVPVYNGQKYIDECIASIVNGSNDEWYEVIIVNDGSTDETSAILQGYQSFNNIRIYNNDNHGVSYSRNCGLKHSNGDYIMFVDADDRLKDGWKEIILKYISTNQDYIVFTAKDFPEKEIYNYITAANDNNICVGGPYSKIINRRIIINNNITFNEELMNGEDMIFNCAVLKKCHNIMIVNESFYLYRYTPSSATNRFDEKIIDNDREFNTIISAILSDNQDVVLFSKINGLYTILDRISHCEKYSIAREYISMIDLSFYETKIKKYKYVPRFKQIIVHLFFRKKYKVVYYLLKNKNALKRAIKKKTNFINI